MGGVWVLAVEVVSAEVEVANMKFEVVNMKSR